MGPWRTWKHICNVLQKLIIILCFSAPQIEVEGITLKKTDKENLETWEQMSNVLQELIVILCFSAPQTEVEEMTLKKAGEEN